MVFPFFNFSASFHLSQVFLDHLGMFAVMVFEMAGTGTLPRVEMRIDAVDFPCLGLRRDKILMRVIDLTQLL
jgi:hypothetical protein